MSEEIWDEKLARVELMASGPEWDLSDNDRAALAAVLKDRAHMEASWATATRKLREGDQRYAALQQQANAYFNLGKDLRRQLDTAENTISAHHKMLTAVTQELTAAKETVSLLRDEVNADDTAVRQVARECRLDDELTIARQEYIISKLRESLERCGGYLMTALPVNQPEWLDGIPEIIAEADAALASIPKEQPK